MGMETIAYARARSRVRTGDVVAFGGEGLLSKIIKAAGRTVVSHAGVIVAPSIGKGEPRLLESTVRLQGREPVWGAGITSFRDRWEQYRGDVWVLPLGAGTRARFDEEKFREFAQAAQGATFDVKGGLRIIIKEFLEELERKLMFLSPDAQGFIGTEPYFCSEVVVAAMREAGIIPDVAPSDVSPKDLCRWAMYEDTYFIREGHSAGRDIPGFNSLPPGTTF